MQKSETVSDFRSFEIIKKYLSKDFQTQIFPFEYDPIWLKSVLGQAFCALTIRYHGAIFGLTQAVPTIGFSVSSEYNVKLSGVFQMFNEENWLFNLKNLNTNDLFSQLEIIAEQRNSIIEKLGRRYEKLKSLPDLKEILTGYFDERNRK